MRNKLIVLLGLLLAIVGFSFIAAPPDTPADTVRKMYYNGLNVLEQRLQQLRSKIPSANTNSIQAAFFQARLAYKRIEPITEYFFRYQAEHFNGLPIPTADEVEMDKAAHEPQGLQLIESFLYPAYDPASRKEVLKYIDQLLYYVREAKQINETYAINDEYIFDALLEQLYRIASMGITGADSPLAFLSLPEAGASLETIQKIISLYGVSMKEQPGMPYDSLQNLLRDSRRYLSTNKNFNTFDRMAFIVRYLDPITAIIGSYKLAKGYKDNPAPMFYSAINKSGSMFTPGIFDPNKFLDDNSSNADKIELGRRLFFEQKLSATNKRSCAGCHLPSKAFTDGLRTSLDLDEHSPLPRNAPTLWNASVQRSLFHDARSRSLETLVMEVLSNKREMNASAKAAAENTVFGEAYKQLYANAYPGAAREAAAYNVCNAIACYVRTLLSFNSRFDQYMRGDKTQLNNQEIKGFNLFMGKAKCGTCHFMPVFNGSKPPRFYFQEVEVLGVPAANTKRPVLDKDPGRFLQTGLEFHRFAFKTPTVRNIALTGPYMHNGVFKTLEEVVDFYNKGGGKGLKIAPPNQTLPFDKLNLTAREQQAIVAFMKALTDTSGGD